MNSKESSPILPVSQAEEIIKKGFADHPLSNVEYRIIEHFAVLGAVGGVVVSWEGPTGPIVGATVGAALGMGADLLVAKALEQIRSRQS